MSPKLSYLSLLVFQECKNDSIFIAKRKVESAIQILTVSKTDAICEETNQVSNDHKGCYFRKLLENRRKKFNFIFYAWKVFLLISFPILNDEYIDWSKLTEQIIIFISSRYESQIIIFISSRFSGIQKWFFYHKEKFWISSSVQKDSKCKQKRRESWKNQTQTSNDHKSY